MNRTQLIVVTSSLTLLSGCADTLTYEQLFHAEKVGFWHGLWHGLIVVFSWFGSLFSDDIAVYALNNNGGWYDVGFLLGIVGLVLVSLIKLKLISTRLLP